VNKNKDSEKMYILGGNFFDVIPYEGRYDAQPLALFSIRPDKTISYKAQGNLAEVKDQVRDLKWMHNKKFGDILIVASNNDSLKFLSYKK
jgi:hypothetical protein